MAWRGVPSSWSRVPTQADGSLCFQLLAIATTTPTQADLLRLLSMICRHFAACAFSIRVTRSFDAVRLVVVACLATLADALMRIRASDVPSLLCLSYCGAADGPGEPVRTPRLYTLYFIPYSPSLCVLPVSRHLFCQASRGRFTALAACAALPAACTASPPQHRIVRLRAGLVLNLIQNYLELFRTTLVY